MSDMKDIRKLAKGEREPVETEMDRMRRLQSEQPTDDPLDNPTMNFFRKAKPFLQNVGIGIAIIAFITLVVWGLTSLVEPKTVQSGVPAEIVDLHEVGDPLREKDIFYLGTFQGCLGTFILSSSEFNPLDSDSVIPYCIEVTKAGVDLGVYEISLEAMGE